MSSYLVTGAAGFIGSCVARELIAQGHEVVTIDNLSTGKRSVVPEGCAFIEGDCGNPDTIAKLEGRKFEAILHIAGQSSGEVSFENPVYDLQTNTQSTLLLLQHARRTGCSKFVYASSMSVYGDHPENPFCSETTPAVPKSFYAVGKLASENYMRIFSSSFGINCTALRFFNVYGIGQNLDNLKQGMASIFLAMAIANRHIVVKGAKDRFRDFVNVKDVVRAVLLAAERGEGFGVYNVSTGIGTTVESVIGAIKENLHFSVDEEYIAGTPGDQHGISGDFSKIKEAFGWEPSIDFKSGMGEMVAWAMRVMGKG